MNTRIIVMILYFIIMHLLCVVKETKGTKLMESLQCLTDYDSHITCQWAESRRSRKFVNMGLYSFFSVLPDTEKCRWNCTMLVKEERGCESCDPTETKSRNQSDIKWTCRLNRADYVTGLEYEFTFLPHQNLDIQLNLTRNDTLQAEQQIPELYFTEETYFLHLSDYSYYLLLENNTTEVLQCEVNYKPESEPWENSATGECKETWGFINRGRVSGEKHLARMRVKTFGSWSKWSSEIHLEPKRSGDEAKPQNLQCFLSDVKSMTCTWTQRVEVTDSVSFQLYHKQKESSTEHSCHPRCKQLLPNLPHLACCCWISLEDENNLPTISIRTVEEVKSFRPCIHISIPPRNLTIREVNNGEAYTASWHMKGPAEKPEFKLHFELCYWTEGEPSLNKESSDCPRSPDKLSRSQYPEVVLKLGEQLKPLRTYHAKLRMRVADENPKDCFQGPWSQWSSIQTWETKSVASNLILYIIITVCSIILIIGCAFGYKRLMRYKKKWEENIPDPSKSKHIVDFQRKVGGSTSMSTKHDTYEEITSRFSAVSDSVLIGLKDNETDKTDEAKNTQTYRAQSYQNNTYFSPAPLENDDKETIHDYSDLQTDVKNVEYEIPNFTLCSFNGPYLLCPSKPEGGASAVNNIKIQADGSWNSGKIDDTLR